MLTRKRLKELFRYDPMSGSFMRLLSVGKGKSGSISGTITKNGYLVIVIDGVIYYAHRLAFLYMEGVIPSQVDHKNHIRTDNRWDNLRPVDAKENKKNITISSRNTSGFTGVSFDKKAKKWAAYIKIDGVKTHLGYFHKKGDAVLARKRANERHGFHENHGMNGKYYVVN